MSEHDIIAIALSSAAGGFALVAFIILMRGMCRGTKALTIAMVDKVPIWILLAVILGWLSDWVRP